MNQKWCTDFTYLFLTDGSKRYNCTIIDLYDRSVVANITNKHITADLAKRTLQKAIDSQPGLDTGCLILHSDNIVNLRKIINIFDNIGKFYRLVIDK